MKGDLSAFNFKKTKIHEKIETDEIISQKKSGIICKYSKTEFFLCTICDIKSYLSPKWLDIFEEEFEEPYFQSIIRSLHTKEVFFPPINRVFFFTNFFPISDTKIVIIGQDPYHLKGRATGLAFDSPPHLSVPPSLRNIRNEVRRDYLSASCDLMKWAEQGVLLLNGTLTVFESKPNSHSSFGWSIFTDRIIRYINLNCKNVAFLLWGAFAAKKKHLVNEKNHLVLISTHPSPFSVDKGFKGCGHFRKANEYLEKNQKEIIKW